MSMSVDEVIAILKAVETLSGRISVLERHEADIASTFMKVADALEIHQDDIGALLNMANEQGKQIHDLELL